MNFKKINDITGWLIFAIATTVYTLTVEETASFWDCGEFIAAAYKMQVPHPPGAPFFLLVGRMFSFMTNDVTQVAYWVNMSSVLSSSFCILFLFWSISLIAKKLIAKGEDNPSMDKVVAIMGSAAVGALAYTFSDTFWFSAVEAEVYAMSSFFTAFVFWAILKWDAAKDEKIANKWLIMTAYMTGLSIGVHLLNLVALPALAMVYYFKKYKPSVKGGAIAFFAGLIIVGIINNIIIPGLPSFAQKFEIFFVNSMNLPIGGGILIFCLLFFGALVYGIHYSVKKQKEVLNTALLSLAFILIGYSSYMIIPIRSSYNPPIDENNPEDVISFLSYLKREQYGDRPLIFGPTAKAKVINVEEKEVLYRKKDGKYIPYDTKKSYVYDKENQSLFPRIYSSGSSQTSEDAYESRGISLKRKRKITLADNIDYFINYQLKEMYWRYFMWNFAGRAHDIQDADWLMPWEGTTDNMPHMIKTSKARNQYFMLPLILGILGLFYHYGKDKNTTLVVGMLFFFTGIALVIYLNSPPAEPRERDYIYVGSFYAFAIWIGLGVLAISEYLGKIIKSNMLRPALATALSISAPLIMAKEGWDDHDRSGRWHSVDSAKNLLNSCAPNAILFTGGDNDTFPLWYVQEVEGFRTDVRVCNLSLLNTDWYIDLMKQDAYDSKALPISFKKEEYIQGTNDAVLVQEIAKYQNGVMVAPLIKSIREKNTEVQARMMDGSTGSIIPSKTFVLPVNVEKVIASGIIPKELEGLVQDKMKWSVDRRQLEKKHLIMLDMLANNNWERPIYFSTTVGRSEYMGLAYYMQMEGLAVRVLPVRNRDGNGRVNTDIMYERMMKNTFWRGLNDETRFFDENYKRFPANSRNKFFILADALTREGKKEKALEVINYCLSVMPDKSLSYDYYIPDFVGLLYRLGEKERADEMGTLIFERIKNDLNYFSSSKASNSDEQIKMISLQTLSFLGRAYQVANMKEKADECYQLLSMHYKPQ